MNNQLVISDYIFPIHQYGKMGTIHSVFERSFNLKVQDQLINVANFHNYLSSFGMFLPDQLFQEIFPYVQQGNKVKITENQLTFYSTVGVKTIQLTPAEVVSLNITHFKLEKDQLRLLRDRLLARNLERRIGLLLDERAKHIFKKMIQKQKVWTLSEWQEVTNYLIGRGKGLTPSGDDILVAYQTILFILADERAAALAATLSAANLSTTDVSKGYIASSAKGYVNSLLYQLLLDLENHRDNRVDENIDRIIQIGHSSGKDMSFGMLLALQSVELDEK
ncbi:DUF2877 domain-containing protein [Enterococcus faecalis]|uniref:DUF2877 domain-containing protein n=1 Tax=Enterococcus faecalis TaxID=1351 RepID=UPI000CF2313C|nr:DUF2877 domain-containing protein [Enterococcus faecalis]PQE58625.1 hypothetical protein CUS05_01985 [Enterococcus faecalis]